VEWPADSDESKRSSRWWPREKSTPCRDFDQTDFPFNSERIIRYAFEYAVKHKRRKVTAVAKANIMKCTDGLFFDVGREVAKAYDGKIEYEERLVDNMCMQLVQKPELYDVLVLPNLYGDILSICVPVDRWFGIAPGANIGDHGALFEAVHGSAPKYAGQKQSESHSGPAFGEAHARLHG